MKLLRTLLVGAFIALAVASPAIYSWAQQLTSRTLTGLETWQVATGGPGGPSIFTNVAQVRNATGVATTALTSGTLSTLTNTTASTLISTTASVSLTVNLPATPWDGEIFEWVNGSTIGAAFTAGTIAVTDGSTILNGTTTGAMTAGTSAEWRYALSTNTWYKIR